MTRLIVDILDEKMLKFYFHGNDGVDGEYEGPLMSPYQIFIIVQNCLNVIKQIKNNAGSKEGGYLKAAYSPKDQKVIFRSVDPGSGV